MRDLRRNSFPIYYSLYLGKEYVTDENGYKTAEQIPKYSTPVQIKLPVTQRSGYTDETYFGADLNYSRIIMTAKKLPIDEHSLLYIESEPELYEVDESDDLDGNFDNADGGLFDFNLSCDDYNGGTFNFEEDAEYDYHKADYKVVAVRKYINQTVYAIDRI